MKEAAKAFEFAFVENKGLGMFDSRTKYRIQEQPSGTLHPIPEPKKQFTVQFDNGFGVSQWGTTSDKFINEPFSTLEYAREGWVRSRRHYSSGLGQYLESKLRSTSYRILETPGDIVHACYVEPKKQFVVQASDCSHTIWQDSTYHSRPYDSLELALAAANEKHDLCNSWQGYYRILETPGDIVHEIPAPDVTVVVKVSVPAKQWAERDLYESNYQKNGLYIAMTGSIKTVKILSVTEEK